LTKWTINHAIRIVVSPFQERSLTEKPAVIAKNKDFISFEIWTLNTRKAVTLGAVSRKKIGGQTRQAIWELPAPVVFIYRYKTDAWLFHGALPNR
jgi:hypothetical protein